MARIGIFETEHFEGAYPVIRLFDNGKNDITIFSYPQSYRQFQYLFGDDAARFHWIIKEDNESKYHFIYRIYKEARRNNIQLLYLNTITNNHFFYALMIRLLPKVRVVVTLHDINTYFSFKFAFGLRRCIRYTGKRSLIRAVKEFNVVAATMVPYLQSKLPGNKRVYNVPGAVFEGNLPHSLPPAETTTINIVVPGTLDNRRRNYDTVFELLHICGEANIPVSVTLLGGYSGEHGNRILEKCKAYAQAHTNLSFYETGVVDQPEFDRVMNNAHFVFTPSVINTIISDGITETYGISISSGNLFDVIKHAKPFIIPEALKMPDNMESSCIHYKTANDIVVLLQRVISEPSFYDELTQKALNNSREYTIAKVRERNALLFS
jgi:hypothetical protein